jgi:cyclopropane fatty-acyl-phospholipid synthase-like methyltransferase
MGTNSDNKKNHNQKVGKYFEKTAVSFDAFYEHKRSTLMQWIDRKFRSDVFLRYDLTFQTIKPLKDKTVLDIGCGSGPYLVEAARRGAKRVVGLDMVPEMLELARQRVAAAGLAAKCQFIRGTFPEDAPEDTFDYAIVMGVMDYVGDSSKFLSTLAQKVKISAVLSCPSIHWFRTPLRKFRYWLKHCPVYFYEPCQIKKMSKAVGFSDIKVEKIPGAGMDYFVTLYK